MKAASNVPPTQPWPTQPAGAPQSAAAPKAQKRHGCLTAIAVIAALIVLGAIIGALHHSKPVKAADVTQRTAGHFVRSGCLGCSNTNEITTNDAYCGWDGNNVVVHVTFGNTSVQTLTVQWHPSYSIANGTAHGTGLSSIQSTKIPPGQSQSVFVKQSPAGTTAGSLIAKCNPSFFLVNAG